MRLSRHLIPVCAGRQASPALESTVCVYTYRERRDIYIIDSERTSLSSSPSSTHRLPRKSRDPTRSSHINNLTSVNHHKERFNPHDSIRRNALLRGSTLSPSDGRPKAQPGPIHYTTPLDHVPHAVALRQRRLPVSRPDFALIIHHHVLPRGRTHCPPPCRAQPHLRHGPHLHSAYQGNL